MLTMIEQCEYYSTTGYPMFKPLCKLGHRASLKCHAKKIDCKDYIPYTYSSEFGDKIKRL